MTDMPSKPFDRRPLNKGCYPAQPAPPAEVTDPCAMLPKLRGALYALMSGGQSQRVRDGEREMWFHAASIPQLRAEIRKLETMCGPGAGARAVRAGPYVPPGSVRGWWR
jgi:hypothetical protein